MFRNTSIFPQIHSLLSYLMVFRDCNFYDFIFFFPLAYQSLRLTPEQQQCVKSV